MVKTNGIVISVFLIKTVYIYCQNSVAKRLKSDVFDDTLEIYF